MKKLFAVMSLVMVITSIGVIAYAAEETELKAEEESINRVSTNNAKDEARTAELAQHFKVSEAKITEMRSDKKMGWGEITIALAMSQELSVKSQGTDNPMTTEQSLSEVLTLRYEQKMGWGRIAKEKGFKLGPVISSVHSGKAAIRTADRRTDRLEKNKIDKVLPTQRLEHRGSQKIDVQRGR